MNETELQTTIEKCLSLPHHLLWFCGATGIVAMDGASATTELLARARSSDISPFRFFDPSWFRARYAVNGPNAFLSYLRNPLQRLALPSPLFAPRWYARRYMLSAKEHPFLDLLEHADERDPHPLIDANYLRDQAHSWFPGAIALRYITEPDKFRLKPHPLFDGGWYLDRNPDVAAAGVNPLEHYLRHGHLEGRNPNRIFNVRWYRQTHLKRRIRSKVEPFTAYVTLDYLRGLHPAPGLQALAKPTIKLTAHGPQPYIDRMRDGRGIYATLRHRPKLAYEAFQQHMSGTIQDYNPMFPEHALLLRKQRLAIIYTPKCASAKLVYWWMEQSNLLDLGLQFSVWSHSFENAYRRSRNYLWDALTFEPDAYQVYKFVRNPLSRAVSSFNHFLSYPEIFGAPAGRESMAFFEFVDMVRDSRFLNGEMHFRPQVTDLEKSGVLRPKILKLEDGLKAHLLSLERSYGLQTTTYEKHWEIRKVIERHGTQARRNIFAGPHVQIPFGRTPDAKSLLTKAAAARVYELYGDDFDAYGYDMK